MSKPNGRAGDATTEVLIEPPEPEYLCKRCVRRLTAEAVRERRLPTHWIPARWERRAAKQLGFVRAGPSADSWDHWFAPEHVPDGYVIRTSSGERPQ